MKITTIHAVLPHSRKPEFEFHRLVSEIEALFDGLEIEEEVAVIREEDSRNRTSFIQSAFVFLHQLNSRLVMADRVCRMGKEFALMIFPDSVRYADITDLPISQAMEIMTEIVCKENQKGGVAA